ncbi:hypothetical protein [Psychroflexus aestuariivivens]|uniref:hypothetical protein n=1 Tax=Psychroflexus aestuariivivens TaxID=1795040 RepID=UPI000FD73401|nr:hypothetical protein [Psychroflexus aestuariivivens]
MRLFLIFCLISFWAQSQNDAVRGKIYADSIETYQINVINIDQELGQVSSKNGDFEIPAKLGDSILFTSLQHKTFTLKVDEKHLETRNSIFMEMQINELDEVVLTEYDLSGDLGKDIEQVQTHYLDQRQFGFNKPRKLSPEKRALYTATSSGGGVPLDYIIMSLNGQMKKLRQRIENAELKNNQQRVLASMSYKFFEDDLKIEPKYHEDFAYYCAESQDFMNTFLKDDKLLLIEAFKTQAVDYIALKNSDE